MCEHKPARFIGDMVETCRAEHARSVRTCHALRMYFILCANAIVDGHARAYCADKTRMREANLPPREKKSERNRRAPEERMACMDAYKNHVESSVAKAKKMSKIG